MLSALIRKEFHILSNNDNNILDYSSCDSIELANSVLVQLT